MQHVNATRRLRPAVALLGAVALFSACSSDEQSPLGNLPAKELAVGVQVSSADARSGEQIAVAVAVEGMELGGIQGTLRYDAGKLSYVGQAPEGAMVTMVNDSHAAAGEIRTLSYVPGQALPGRTGALVFAVKAPGYAGSLSYEMEEATDRAVSVALTRYRKAGTSVAADLAVPADARRMDYQAWVKALYPGQAEAGNPLRPSVAGQYLANLHYGNANLSAENANAALCTSVLTSDAAYVANIAVGNNSVLAVDFPTRDPVVAGNVFPASTPIPGVNGDGSRTITTSDAAAIANEAVGNPRAVVCDLVPGREPAATNVVTIAGSITTDRTFTRDTLYKLSGVVRVSGGATLTVQPGTRVEGIYVAGAANITALIIERDGRIIADGSPLQPIVFSCDQTPKFKGCWGGLAIAGNGPLNSSQAATLTSPIIAGRATAGGCFEVIAEGTLGTPAQYSFGGCSIGDNSGIVRYVIAEYGGFSFAANRELNNITVGGVGSGTIIDYVQLHAGLDDGFEIWGGDLNVSHLVMTANSDDDFDFANGWSGNAQFLISQKDSLDGDKTLEIDNTEAAATYNDLPRVNAQIYNYTMVGKADPAGTGGPVATNNVEDAINLRRGARPDFFNLVMMGYPTLMDLDDDATCPTGADLSTEVKWQSVTAFNNTRVDNTDLEAVCQPYPAATSMEGLFFAEAAFGNVAAATNPLIAPFNVTTPDFRPVSAAAVSQGSSTVPPANGFFDVTANYRGAVAPLTSGGIPWYAGWTRVWTNATTP